MSSILVNSTHLVDRVNNSTFQVFFDRAINFDNKVIALTSASLYFSWRNVTERNNKLSYVWHDGVTYNVEIPPGFYEIADINRYLQFIMRKNKHFMLDKDGFLVYFIDIIINPTLYSIDIITYPIPSVLPEGASSEMSLPSEPVNPVLNIPQGMHEILGYPVDFSTTSDINFPKIHNSTTAPNVNPNNTVIIVCDQVFNEFSNLGVLYSLSPSVSIGSLIQDRPADPIYSKLKFGFYNQLTFRILDAKTFQPVQIVDGEINFIFNIKTM